MANVELHAIKTPSVATVGEEHQASVGSSSSSTERRSFNPPAEADWHRMISEAAYFIAARRNFASGSALEDWLQAETEVKAILEK